MATLSVSGDGLDPDEITAALGKTPSHSERKSELIRMRNGGTRIAKTGIWRLKADPLSPGDLDTQTTRLLQNLTEDLAIWTNLAERFDVRLFCGLFLAEQNEGLSLSDATLLQLGKRGIRLDLDIYAPDRPDDGEPVPDPG
jgi:hypothetical protein